jgi:hypothetical protein
MEIVSVSDFENSNYVDSLQSAFEEDSKAFEAYVAATTIGSILTEAVDNYNFYAYLQDGGYSLLDDCTNLAFFEEIELDEEINSLEEEIAKIEQDKRTLKASSLPGSPTADSPASQSSPSMELKYTYLSSSSFEDLFHSSIEEVPKVITIEQQSSDLSKPKKRKSTKSKKETMQPSTTTITSAEPKTKKRRTNTKENTKPRKRTSKKKSIANSELFKLEQILKIKNVSQDEDEDVDIL